MANISITEEEAGLIMHAINESVDAPFMKEPKAQELVDNIFQKFSNQWG